MSDLNQVPENNGKGLAIGALVCGILSIAGGLIPFVGFFTSILAIVAVVLGIIARKKLPEGQRGMATAGLILGIVGVVFSVIGFICIVCVAATGALGAL